jgi:hypothetical protein
LRPAKRFSIQPSVTAGRAVVEPRHQAEREQVLGPQRVARRDVLHPLDGALAERVHRDPPHDEPVQRAVLERVALVAHLLQVARGEGVLVGDDRRAALELADVRLQRGRVHRDQHVRGVARRDDVARGEVDLEARYAGERAGRGADLRREVRQRREVVAERRRRVGEAAADELHAVAGIPGEPHDDPLPLLHTLRYSTHLSTRPSSICGSPCEQDNAPRRGDPVPRRGW